MRKSFAALLFAPLLAFAQAYPAKPVKLVVPFAPGGGSDFTGRLIAAKLSERIGTQFVVENRAGAGGNLGASEVVRAAPDGYTLLIISASYTVNPSVYKLSFDPVNDITPIIQISGGPYVVAVHPSVPANTLAEFVAYAKKEPQKLAYGTSGQGSIMHVASEYFLDAAKIKVLHVPYKGTGPALQDTIGGQVQLVFGAIPATLPHVRAGRLRALAVTTDKRVSAAPDLPTVAESGYPGYEVTNWHGLVGPKGLPREVVERINREINEIITSEDMKKHMATEGLDPAGGTPARFGEILKSEAARWAKVVQQAGIKVQ
ncbi:MAG TPA: tripartite tricarboxylate transporter substrate binding protein [Burkholderiales bacterium]|nr:tripartite tricarboxylate transporter substrate binding protein [Burkholderiales bacterium]